MLTYTLALSLFDFVPVLAFLIGALYLIRFARLYERQVVSSTMLVGSVLAVLAGATKATWKLLVTRSIADIVWLGEAQFALMAPGYTLMFFSALMILLQERKEPETAVGAMAAWKIPFLAVMIISSFGLHCVLGILGWRKRKYIIPIMYAISIIVSFGLAGMATGEQTIAQQWFEEGINSIGQIAFAMGSIQLFESTK